MLFRLYTDFIIKYNNLFPNDFFCLCLACQGHVQPPVPQRCQPPLHAHPGHLAHNCGLHRLLWREAEAGVTGAYGRPPALWTSSVPPAVKGAGGILEEAPTGPAILISREYYVAYN